MKSDDKISEALDLVELVEFTVISAINEASSQQKGVIPGVGSLARQELPLGGMYRSLNTARKLLRDLLNNQSSVAKSASNDQYNIKEYTWTDNPDPGSDSTLADKPVNKAPLQEAVDASAGRPAGISKGVAKSEGGQIGVDTSMRKSSGLASRIRPVPDEVRGRVRELVDMLEEEDLNSEQYKETRA